MWSLRFWRDECTGDTFPHIGNRQFHRFETRTGNGYRIVCAGKNGRTCGLIGRSGRAFEVGFYDASVGPRAFDLTEINALRLSHFPSKGRSFNSVWAFRWACYWRGTICLNGGFTGWGFRFSWAWWFRIDGIRCRFRFIFAGGVWSIFYLWSTFSRFANGGYSTTNGNFIARFTVLFEQNTVFKAFHFHRRLIRFDFGNHIAVGYGIAFFFQPIDQCSHRHGIAQFGHFNQCSHKSL